MSIVLRDNDPMPWGKYIGTKMANLDAKYLMWVKDNVSPNYKTIPVLKYIQENLDAIKKELK